MHVSFFSVKPTRALMALSEWSVSGPELPMYIKGKVRCWGKDKVITGAKMTNGKEILYSRIIMGTWQEISCIICKVTTSQLCAGILPLKDETCTGNYFFLAQQQQFWPCEENSNTHTITCSSMFLFSSSLQTFHLRISMCFIISVSTG